MVDWQGMLDSLLVEIAVKSEGYLQRHISAFHYLLFDGVLSAMAFC